MRPLSFLFPLLTFFFSSSAEAGDGYGQLRKIPETRNLRMQLARYGFTAGRFIRTNPLPVENGRKIPQSVEFLLYTPKRGREKIYPMVVYLPGRGELGEVIHQFHEHTVFDHVTSPEFQKKRPCFLLAISPPRSAGTLIDGLPGKPSPIQMLLADCIREIVRTRSYPQVDPRRIYITGLSYGGGGVYGLMTSYPEMFACGVPIASFPPPPCFVTSPLRLWHIHNEGDYVNKGLDDSLLSSFRNAIARSGGEFRIGTFPADGHNAWRTAWREDSVWEWMFKTVKKGKGSPPPSSVVNNDNTQRLSAYAFIPFEPGHEARRVVDGLNATWFESDCPLKKGRFLLVESSELRKGRVSISRIVSNVYEKARILVEFSPDGKCWFSGGTIPAKTGTFFFSPAFAIRYIRLSLISETVFPIRIREVTLGES